MPENTSECSLSRGEPVGTSSFEALACNAQVLNFITHSSERETLNRVGDPIRSIVEMQRAVEASMSVADPKITQLIANLISNNFELNPVTSFDYGLVSSTVADPNDYGSI